MSQKCEHHDHHHDTGPTGKAFSIAIALNLLFVVVELYSGILYDSLALISDALHNLTDVFGLLLAWLGLWLAQKSINKKFSLYAAAINSALLLLSSVWVIIEALERYNAQIAPVAPVMIAVSLVGFAINFFTARQFHHGHQHDLNIKSAYLHLMADAAVSLGVAVTGVIILYSAQNWLDPVISAVISVIIILSAWKIFYESVRLLRRLVPAGVNVKAVEELLQLYLPGVVVSSLQIYALSTAENKLVAQLDILTMPDEPVLNKLKHDLSHRFKIAECDLVFRTVSE